MVVYPESRNASHRVVGQKGNVGSRGESVVSGVTTISPAVKETKKLSPATADKREQSDRDGDGREKAHYVVVLHKKSGLHSCIMCKRLRGNSSGEKGSENRVISCPDLKKLLSR